MEGWWVCHTELFWWSITWDICKCYHHYKPWFVGQSATEMRNALIDRLKLGDFHVKSMTHWSFWKDCPSTEQSPRSGKAVTLSYSLCTRFHYICTLSVHSYRLMSDIFSRFQLSPLSAMKLYVEQKSLHIGTINGGILCDALLMIKQCVMSFVKSEQYENWGKSFCKSTREKKPFYAKDTQQEVPVSPITWSNCPSQHILQQLRHFVFMGYVSWEEMVGPLDNWYRKRGNKIVAYLLIMVWTHTRKQW